MGTVSRAKSAEVIKNATEAKVFLGDGGQSRHDAKEKAKKTKLEEAIYWLERAIEYENSHENTFGIIKPPNKASAERAFKRALTLETEHYAKGIK